MADISTLQDFLADHAAASPLAMATSAAILALAGSAASISRLIRYPDADANLGAIKGSENADGDDQKALDVMADDIITAALGKAGVAIYLSEEQSDPIALQDDGLVIVASDPLDGSSNIDTNVSVGTIFSVLDRQKGVLQKGRDQLAAGFFVYGPQTTLLLTLGNGVFAFAMDDAGMFHAMPWTDNQPRVTIKPETGEFGINASNQRHWSPPVAAYIADCLAGVDGPRRRNFNMRWVGSLVADGWRIFRRGGIFLYPADSRDGYANGRLRLVYEAAPVAMLVEQAGGRAVMEMQDVLDVVPDSLHQRVPLVFGSISEVDVTVSYRS